MSALDYVDLRLNEVDPYEDDWHEAQSPQEVWAKEALFTLTGLDWDFVTKRNGIGFNKSDSSFGHRLVEQLQIGVLTSRQWRLAIKICRKYWRQVGKCPR